MEAKDYVNALIAAGLNQVQIAERSGIPQPTISKVYRGDVDDVLSRNYRRLQDLHSAVMAELGSAKTAKPKRVKPKSRAPEERAESATADAQG